MEDESDFHQADDNSDPDSIATYMEKLLARSRKNVESLPVQPTPSTPPINVPPANEPATPLDGSVNLSADAAPPAPMPPLPELSAPPSHEQDKTAARADLNTLRQLANLSARTEIATHASKELHGKMLVKSLLAVTSFTVAGVLLTGEVWGSVSYYATGWAAAIVGIMVAAELARSTLLIHNISSNGESDHLVENRNDPEFQHAATSIVSSDERAKPITIDDYIFDDEQVMPPTG